MGPGAPGSWPPPFRAVCTGSGAAGSTFLTGDNGLSLREYPASAIGCSTSSTGSIISSGTPR